MEAEDRRLREETAQQLVKIQSQAEREIGSAVKGARTELKAYAAELALELAEKQLRARMTAEAERGLVAGFVRDLERQRLN
jgi:F0F1-type ATP synthase membrane subunit b/b'